MVSNYVGLADSVLGRMKVGRRLMHCERKHQKHDNIGYNGRGTSMIRLLDFVYQPTFFFHWFPSAGVKLLTPSLGS